MREIRLSGSEGGGPEPKTGPPTPIEFDIFFVFRVFKMKREIGSRI